MDATLVINALAEPRRREILRMVRNAACSANELRDALDITQQAVSQHLHILESAGLVRADRPGRGRRYTLAADGIDALDRFLSELWPDGLQRLKSVLEAKRDS
ncbi:MAG: winged helix-turn-helix transcriptional regulator [Propionivibrio sp.]|uniref:ArsR family transcriptional regulator n=1 Tax=Rhizobium rosettiformans TaxID=1368430 RepID=A0ABX7F2K4_9HYPH|nr:metalloregulator ArsR/SmtB family transcription factor [Rhizobium rosettiformans]MBP8277066.1 winged helix-turn-helix transcriptional regulator [Propionivibrio sp.]QRF54720.1 ArsR family transcriptional regulator [Rhizobium rosettiformans]